MVLMDVLSVRNVYEDAERAKDKKAALGADITIENFSDETVNALDMIDDLDDLKEDNYAWLRGECSANSQISPYGIFQEMILTFFNIDLHYFLTSSSTALKYAIWLFSSSIILNIISFKFSLSVILNSSLYPFIPACSSIIFSSNIFIKC